MKKLFIMLLAAAMLFSLAGCQKEELRFQDNGEASTEVEWRAQYIRTDGISDGVQFPDVRVIHSLQELKDYYSAWRETFDLERRTEVYSDTSMGFLDACDGYDAAFFEENYLIFALLEESSGSIRHEVTSVTRNEDEKIAISVDRKEPEAGTCDMAQWHIILELSRDALVESSEDTVLYVLGSPVYPADMTVTPIGKFKEPPKGQLITPDGVASLCTGGYSWYSVMENGMTAATDADQPGRPLPIESLEQVSVNSKYAETVYAPVLGSDTYVPTNSLRYLMKLNWETEPSSVTYTCWPERVWQNSDTPEEAVVSQKDFAFYAKPGGYVYEIVATWDDVGVGYYGTANYYVFISDATDDVHIHATALTAQTVDDPVTGYCGNTQTTLYIDGEEYSFMYGYSVTLTDLLVNLDYNPNKVCRCMPQYRADTEFGSNYHIHLDYGFVRCDKGQADLTQEQIDTIAEIINWAETTNCQYPIDN